MSESADANAALPARPRKRDLLGHICFYLHFAVMLFIVFGWVIPWKPILFLYLMFVPGVFLQWQVNKDTCILNNTENWLRTGRWRNRENNPEEGAWLLTLARNVTGIAFTATLINALNYSVLIVVWLLGLAHVMGKF